MAQAAGGRTSGGGRTGGRGTGSEGRKRCKNAAAIQIQARLRGLVERKHGHMRQVELYAPVVQRHWRIYFETSMRLRRVIAKQVRLTHAAVRMQSVVRMWLTRGALKRKERWIAYKAERMGEIETSLASFGEMRMRLEVESAKVIQCAWRRYVVTCRLRKRVLSIQRVWRGRVGRESAADQRRLRKSKAARRRSTVQTRSSSENASFKGPKPFKPATIREGSSSRSAASQPSSSMVVVK